MIIDAHNHIGARLGASQAPSELVRKMDEAGVDKAVCFPFVEGAFTNDPVAEAVDAFPDRVIPFCAVNPWDVHAPEAVRECVEEYGAKGLKLHPTLHGYRLSDSHVVGPVMNVVAELGMVVICHGGSDVYNSPAEFALFCERHSEVPVLMAHSGMFWLHDEAMEVAARHANLYLEASRVPAWEIRRSVERLGPHRVVFGTDSPFVDLKEDVHKLRTAVPGAGEFELVAGGNLEALLGG